jgi:transcriptional regulator with GAF, ATPase, and Fis domain
MTLQDWCQQSAAVLRAFAARARSGTPREVLLTCPGPQAHRALVRTATQVLAEFGYVVQTDTQFATFMQRCHRGRAQAGGIPTLAVVVRARPVSAAVATGLRWLASGSTLPHLVVSLVDGPYQAAVPLIAADLAVAEGASRPSVPLASESTSAVALEVAEAVARWEHMLAPSPGAAQPALHTLSDVLRRRGRAWEARAIERSEFADEVPRLVADDVLAMLRLSHAVSDPREGIARHLSFLCERLQADGAWVIPVSLSREASPLTGRPARPWSPSARMREAVRSRVRYRGRHGETAECCLPLHVGEALVGMLVACFDVAPDVRITDAEALLEAAGLVIAPLVTAAAGAQGPAAIGDDLIGDSAAMRRVRLAIAQAAATPFPVLIEGESGTGKELVARALHRQSSRRDRRFVAINCAGLTDDLAETELFGCIRGAYTGAQSDRAGIFESANGGTVFLDEVSELSLRVQATLLRVLQEHEVRRVGESQTRKIDVRIVAACNRPLRDAVAAGRFRADLRFRLEVIHLPVPPLRDRLDDLPLLVEHLWASLLRRTGSRGVLAPATIAALQQYRWPGNIRELQNVLAMTLVVADDRACVGPECLPPALGDASVVSAGGHSGLVEARSQFERRWIEAALTRADWIVSDAARELGITRQGLTKMMARLKVQAPHADEDS